MTEEDEDELEYILLHDLEETSPNTLDEFNKVLDDQFSVFKEGDEYNFIKDIRDAFKNDLQKPLIQKIFDTIPEHVFWDIKIPRHKEEKLHKNPYNPSR